MSTNEGGAAGTISSVEIPAADLWGADVVTAGAFGGRTVEIDIAFVTGARDSGAIIVDFPSAATAEGRDAAGRDAGADVEIIDRLDAAAHALDTVDVGIWSDAALSGQLDRLSLALCRVDAQLTRLAEAVRSRGFAITEVELPLAG